MLGIVVGTGDIKINEDYLPLKSSQSGWRVESKINTYIKSNIICLLSYKEY